MTSILKGQGMKYYVIAIHLLYPLTLTICTSQTSLNYHIFSEKKKKKGLQKAVFSQNLAILRSLFSFQGTVIKEVRFKAPSELGK